MGGDGQTFGLDANGCLWRYSAGTYWSAGFGGLEMVATNIGDGNSTNDLVYLRDANSQVWFWSPTTTFWTFTGGRLPNLSAGDNQVFGVGFDGQVWRHNVSTGWIASGGWGCNLASSSSMHPVGIGKRGVLCHAVVVCV